MGSLENLAQGAFIEGVCSAVNTEVNRAMKLHRGMNSAHEAYGVILEELDEFWDEVKVNPKKLHPELAVKRLENMRTELIQIAAMAIRAVHDLGL